MNKNLKLYVTRNEYETFAGNEWPSYEDYLNYQWPSDPAIHAEIADFTQTHLDTGIWFPIRTETSCQSKWNWSTLYLNALASASCHRTQPYVFPLDQLDNFHNLPEKLRDRKIMLEGKWPGHGCEYCRDIEWAGGFSDRQHNLEIRGLTPPELETDLTAVSVTPKIVEIFAQNTCNLSCTYCNGNLSSKIEQEGKKFGEFNRDGVHIPVVSVPTEATEQYFAKFMTWLENNIQTLRRLHLLGGETFLQHRLMVGVLDIIERKPCPSLQFCIFSNMTVPEKIWNLYIPRIKDLQERGHLEVFDLTASIDCWGPESEYARYGLDLVLFEERFAWAADQGPWMRLNANQTVTALTMRTMADLIDKIAFYSKNKHIGHYFQYYTGPQMFQHPKHYAYEFWAKDFENIYRAMPRNTIHQQEAIQRMQGMEKLLQAHTKFNYVEINKMKIYLDELDRRRGTNWRSIFPYLDINEPT